MRVEYYLDQATYSPSVHGMPLTPEHILAELKAPDLYVAGVLPHLDVTRHVRGGKHAPVFVPSHFSHAVAVAPLVHSEHHLEL